MRHSILQAPAHFRELDPQLPVRCRRRNLPHWRQEGATYFVTFRLSDSLPKEVREQIRQEREAWFGNNPEPWTAAQAEEHERRFNARIGTLLDNGAGCCALGSQTAATLVEGSLRHFDGERYHLFSWVVMPNHVHCIVRPLGENSLDEIWESWKGFTSHKLRKLGVDLEPIWFRECYDRIVRDAEHLYWVVQYIPENPWKAGIEENSCPMGIHREWDPAIWAANGS